MLVGVAAKKVSLKVADGDGGHELVVVDVVRGIGPAGAGDAEVQVLGISGPAAIGDPQGSLIVRSVLLRYDHCSAVLGSLKSIMVLSMLCFTLAHLEREESDMGDQELVNTEYW